MTLDDGNDDTRSAAGAEPSDAANEPHHESSKGSCGDPSNDGPVRSVAEEAALLVDLLSERGWGTPGPAGPAAEHGRTAGGERSQGEGAACTCGGRTPAACRICPVCQLISFVQQVSPDTIERVADVVTLAATALRDLAAAQRERRETPTGPGSGRDSSPSHGEEGPTP